MKVLWFAGNPALYGNSNYNGGGWIGALQREILAHKHDSVELFISIPWTHDFEETQNGVTYYGIKKIKHAFYKYKTKEAQQLKRMQDIISSSRPDIIHVFGTEAIYGLVATVTTIPVVIHIQGIISAIFHSWLPQNLSWTKYIIMKPGMYWGYRGQYMLMKRELQMFKSCKHFMGRTIWDKRLLSFLSPQAHYYYCNEMLRPQIYSSTKIWHPHDREKKIIVSVISDAVYKGADIILRTANLLCTYIPNEIEWRIYGMKDLKFSEKLTKIKAAEVGVKAMGIISADDLPDALCDADLFIHPSYIDNSPNSLCEAQVLGLPIIATHVGGIESLVEHEQTGVIVPANDVFMLSAQIHRLINNPNLCKEISTKGRHIALKRHNPETIINDLINIYNSILQ